MGYYDAMANDASAPAVLRDPTGGKKRTNRSAKLKQRKLDARREQWLSQVKNNDSKDKSMAASPTTPLPLPPLSLPRARSGKGVSERRRMTEEEREEAGHHVSSDSESPTHSPTSSGSRRTSRKGYPANSISSGCSIESSSRTVSDAELEEGGDDEAVDRDGENSPLDDWEAVADALTVGNDRRGRDLDSAVTVIQSNAPLGSPKGASGGAPSKPESFRTAPRAWRPDDASRPRSLPSLLKQRSFTVDMERQCGSSHPRGTHSSPSSCPICCEDLDVTDSSFLPCLCGFHLCLFCHKRILEEDGRCPGCRKQYSPMVGRVTDAGGLPFRLSRSFSMSSRS